MSNIPAAFYQILISLQFFPLLQSNTLPSEVQHVMSLNTVLEKSVQFSCVLAISLL